MILINSMKRITSKHKAGRSLLFSSIPTNKKVYKAESNQLSTLLQSTRILFSSINTTQAQGRQERIIFFSLQRVTETVLNLNPI